THDMIPSRQPNHDARSPTLWPTDDLMSCRTPYSLLSGRVETSPNAPGKSQTDSNARLPYATPPSSLPCPASSWPELSTPFIYMVSGQLSSHPTAGTRISLYLKRDFRSLW